jgi:citrate lyase subunit beta / citryl-CoA lyase
MKPYRSMLFVPVTDLRKVQKAFASDTDCVLLDLEDAVALSEKENARRLALEILREPHEKPVFVRVNGIDTPFLFRDLTTLIPGVPAGIMLPKAESPDQIRKVDWVIGQLERESGIPEGQVRLIPLVESGGGVIRAAEIAGASRRTRCLAFGAIDYTLDIGTNLSDDGAEIFYARTHLVAASRAGECGAPVDTVYPNFRDAEGLRRECRLARKLGFQGKMVIHPDQIGVVHEVFSPTAEEIAYASRIVEVFGKAEMEGVASVNLDGKMIDYPVFNRARNLLEGLK